MDEWQHWTNFLAQLDWDLVAIRDQLAEADLTRARLEINAICERVTHVGNRIGSEPGKLLSTEWRRGVVNTGAFYNLYQIKIAQGPDCVLTQRQAVDLHDVFGELVRFLIDGTTAYKQSEIAPEIRKAINCYLSERSFAVVSGNAESPTHASFALKAKPVASSIKKRFRIVDSQGERVLAVPANDSCVGNPGPIVLDIEARTNTRLRDGENPVWFIRLHKDFMDRRDPSASVSFADYCTRRHADKIDDGRETRRKLDSDGFRVLCDAVPALQEQSRWLRAAQFNLYKNLFDWFGPAMLAAGYGLTEQEPEASGPIWKRGHAEWMALTNLKPMDSLESWLTAGVAAGIPTGEIRQTNRKELVDRIRLWTLARRAQLPPQTPPADPDEIERRYFRVAPANGPKPTTAHDGTLFPYEYGSDLHNLWGWGHCLGLFLETENPTNPLAGMRFRPDESAQDAMIRFSVKYPLVIQQVKECIDLTEKRFAEFQQKDTPETRYALAEEMGWQSGRIIAAADAIATAERQTKGTAGRSSQDKPTDSQPARHTPAGRTVATDDYENRKLVAERWESFKDKYTELGYSRCTWETFATWASDEFDDMPSDNHAELKRMVDAYRKTRTPRNLV